MLPPVATYSFFNEGNLTQSGSFFSNDDCINAGIWQITDGQPVDIAGQGSFENYGSVVLCSDTSGLLTFNVPVTNQPSATFTGIGAIAFGMGLNNLGLVEPGCEVGTLTLAQDFDTGAGVTLDVEGDQPGQYDRLVAFGDVSASGTLSIQTPPGLILADTIDIINTAGVFTGVFAEVVVPPDFKVLYRPNGVSLAYSPMVGTATTGLASPWQLSPTIATNEVRLATYAPSGDNLNVWVVDAQGQIVQVLFLENSMQELTIPVADLPAGLYHVQLVNGKESFNLKFVKL